MIRAAALVLLALVATTAGAQTVTIRSGWQQEFTRLVLSIPEGTPWSLGRAGADYALRLDGLAIDTSGVFERIPGERLAALSPGPEALGIELACTCHVSGFLWQPDRLVLDIRDGPPPEGSPFEQALAEEVAPVPDTGAATPPALPLVTERVAAPPVLPDPFRVREEESETLSRAEQALLESIARAATQGLLTPDEDLPAAEPPPPPPEPEPEPPPPPPSRTGPGHPGVAMRTAIDRDLGGAGQVMLVEDPDQVTCLAERHFDIAAWGDDRPFHAQIGDARRALVAEFDDFGEAEVLALARTYVHFGFGTEARHVLAMDGAATRERDILAEIARLLEGMPPRTELLRDQLACGGGPGLWALLTRSAIPARPAIDRNAILRYFQRLPAPVQGLVGPRLSELFLDDGDPDAAAILLGRSESAPGGSSEAAQLAAADLALHFGEDRETLEGLIGSVRSDGRVGPAMLLRIFAMSREAGRPVPDDLLALSGALRFEYRGDPVLAELTAAEMRARIDAGAVDAARAVVEEERSRLDPELRRRLLSEVTIAMAATLDDVAFLERSFAGLPRPLSPAAENAVAARLIDLGFAAAADAELTTPPSRGDARERRYLRAEIALAQGRPERVLDLLTAMSDPRARALRAAAREVAGDFETAYSESGTTDEGAAWRAGAWARLTAADDADMQAASRLVLGEDLAGPPTGTAAPPAPETTPGTLAEGRALLAESEESRALLDSLLARFPVTGEAEE